MLSPILQHQPFNMIYPPFGYFVTRVASLLLLSVVSVSVFLGSSVKAHAAIELGIHPPILHIEVDPPAKVEAPVTVQNLGDETVVLTPEFRFFTAKDETGQVRFLHKDDDIPGANPLILQRVQLRESDHLAPRTITLAPNQQKHFTLTIGIPKTEPLSDYYFSLIFVSQPEAYTQESTSFAAGGIAMNVLLSIGKDKAKGHIAEFSAPPLLEQGPVPFTVRIANTGNYVIVPKGGIVIKNMFGQTIGKVNLLPVNVLAGTTRLLPDSFQAPNATPPAKLNYELLARDPKALWYERFLFGPYTATLTVSLSDDGPILKQTSYFVGLPTYSLLGILAALLLVLLIYTRIKKQLKKQ